MFGKMIIAAAALAVVSGCGKEDPAVQILTETATVNEDIDELGNSFCPVMGGTVAEGQYFDWEGFRIGICCPGCEGTFKADPQTFIPALLGDPGVSEEMKARLSEFLLPDESQP